MKRDQVLSVYTPNHEFIQKRIIRGAPDFESYSERKHLFKRVEPNSIDMIELKKLIPGFERKKRYKKNNRRIKGISFDKILPRERNTKKTLPFHMSANVTNRLAITVTNFKTLESNKFAQGRFQSVHTSFKRPKISKRAILNSTNYSNYYNIQPDESIFDD